MNKERCPIVSSKFYKKKIQFLAPLHHFLYRLSYVNILFFYIDHTNILNLKGLIVVQVFRHEKSFPNSN
jgi:hypothetical protein